MERKGEIPKYTGTLRTFIWFMLLILIYKLVKILNRHQVHERYSRKEIHYETNKREAKHRR